MPDQSQGDHDNNLGEKAEVRPDDELDREVWRVLGDVKKAGGIGSFEFHPLLSDQDPRGVFVMRVVYVGRTVERAFRVHRSKEERNRLARESKKQKSQVRHLHFEPGVSATRLRRRLLELLNGE